MLKHLLIKNVALIEYVEIDFNSGLNILTGETGAGKSIIIDSIMTILGSRTRREIIRTDEDKAIVEALFEKDDEEFLLSREITRGSSICRINGRVVTASMMKEFGEKLVDIHGQHDSQSLLNTDCHINLLDSFAGNEIKTNKTRFNDIIKRQNDLKAELHKLSGSEKDRQRKQDFLEFEINEIENENLTKNEENNLISEKKLLQNSDKVIRSLSSTYTQLKGEGNTEISAIDMLNNSIREMSAITDIKEEYSDLHKRIETAIYELEDISITARESKDRVEYDPERLEYILVRLDRISRLKKKYGDSVSKILEYCRDRKKDLHDLKSSEKRAIELTSGIDSLENDLLEMAKGINILRNEAAGILNSRISDELAQLSMKGVKFKADITYQYSEEQKYQNFYENGLDKVEFLISTNPGEPLKPLSKIASGGEMSRIMLAIKTILAKEDKIPTLIFDEIDIGISGGTADKVGESLSKLSNNHQVICVTHLAQIAAKANTNYLIEKVMEDKKSITRIRKLNKDETIYEIARIISGSEITDITKKHAREMLGY